MATMIEIRITEKSTKANLGAVRDRLIRSFVNRYEVAFAFGDAPAPEARRLVTGMVRRDAKAPGLSFNLDAGIKEVEASIAAVEKDGPPRWKEFRLTGDETMTLTVDGEETVFTLKRIK